jgi:ribonuclease HI
VVEGKQTAGAAVVDGKSVIWASSLPEGTSAQKAELITLIQALRLAEGRALNVYTDSHMLLPWLMFREQYTDTMDC